MTEQPYGLRPQAHTEEGNEKSRHLAREHHHDADGHTHCASEHLLPGLGVGHVLAEHHEQAASVHPSLLSPPAGPHRRWALRARPGRLAAAEEMGRAEPDGAVPPDPRGWPASR